MRISNILWNLFGLGIPLIIAAATIPALIERLGNERFGLLAMAWGLTALSGLFDLGIGRATTQAVSAHLGAKETAKIPVVVSVATRLALRTGIAGGLFFAGLVILGVQNNLKFAPSLSEEVFWAFLLLSVVVPLQSLSAMYRGVNEAYEDFRYISFIRAGLGVANFAGPLAISFWSAGLPWLFGSLIVSRIIGFYSYLRAARRHTTRSQQAEPFIPAAERAKISASLLRFGGWYTISNIIYPLLGQLDRWFIGSLISAAAVTSYVVPFDLIGQSLTLVGAVTTVAFPNIASRIQNDSVSAFAKFRQMLLVMIALMAIVTCAIFAGLPYILPIWLGTDFPTIGIEVGQILALGLVPFTVGSMYVVLIHAHNRVDINAKSHAIQAVIFLPSIYWSVDHFGLIGAAWCWVVRNVMDAALTITWFHNRNRAEEVALS
jgi:O-antigen/teichoic acid export membrane protein